MGLPSGGEEVNIFDFGSYWLMQYLSVSEKDKMFAVASGINVFKSIEISSMSSSVSALR
jgi:hypothetical protein